MGFSMNQLTTTTDWNTILLLESFSILSSKRFNNFVTVHKIDQPQEDLIMGVNKVILTCPIIAAYFGLRLGITFRNYAVSTFPLQG